MEIIINGVKFKNVPDKRYGTKVNDILTQSNIRISADVAEYIQSDDFYALVNSLDIDWNGIEIDDNTTINTTSDLINWLKSIASKTTSVQSDWNQTDSTKSDYIKNKPTIPKGVVIDSQLSSTSMNPVQNKVIMQALENKISKVTGKGLSTNDYTDRDKEKVAAALTEHQDISGKADKTSLQAEVTRATTAEENLRQLYNNLQQSQPIPVTELPATGEAGKIYRLAGTNSYADYMWNGTQFIKMAEYNNAIDNEPTAGSNNLVKSRGVKAELNKKLDKVLSDNIINPKKLISGYIKPNGTFGESEHYFYTTPIDVSNIENITLWGCVDSASVLTYAVYDSIGNFIRGDYETSGVSITYTKQNGDAYIRLSFHDVNITEKYPAYFACLGDTLLPYQPYIDYLPLKETEQRIENKKLDKKMSANIINPATIIHQSFLNVAGQVTEASVGSEYSVSDLIDISNVDNVAMLGIVDSASVLTYAVYDKYKRFIRGVYSDLGSTVVYTKQAGDAYIRIGLRTLNLTSDYPTYFACLGTTLKPFVPYTDYLPLDELSDKVDKLKLNKIMSNNIINPISIIPRRFIKEDGQLKQEVGETQNYSVSELIDVSNIENISMLGIVNSASVLTYAVYDEYKAFRRGVYADLGTTVVYSKQSGDKYIRIGLRTLNLTEDYPTYFACIGNELKPYDKYTDYVPLRDLEEVVARITDTSSEELTPIQCPPLYSIANDVGAKEYWTLNSSFDYVMNLYADHFFDFATGEERRVRWKDNDLDKLPLVNPIGLSEVGGRHLVFNNGTTIWNRTIQKKIYVGMSEASVNIPQISILNSATANFFPKVLFIGDSVTDGSGAYAPLEVTEKVSYSTYWSYIWKLFKDDKVRNNNVGFDFVSLGVQSMRNLMYDNVNYRVSAEGNGGWTLRKYLYEYKFDTPGHKNRFYDADKVGHWQDSELNAAGVGFSISKYLERYKTLADDGITPLVVGETAGTEVTESDKYFNLCTPNIISIQLGFNDVESNYIGDLKLMIKAIREEYPNMPIIVSLIDGTGTYNKELYPEMNPADISLTHNTHHKMHSLMAQIQNETFPSGVYILGSYFIQSTAYSVALKPYMQPQNVKYENFKPYYVENGSSPDLHPGTYAHCDWAYQFSALIKYIMYQENPIIRFIS